MTKQEFLKRMGSERPLKDSLVSIKVGELIDSPDIIGCYQENGVWKIYKTKERGGYYIVHEYIDENEAFDDLYELVYVEKRTDDFVKKQGF